MLPGEGARGRPPELCKHAHRLRGRAYPQDGFSHCRLRRVSGALRCGGRRRAPKLRPVQGANLRGRAPHIRRDADCRAPVVAEQLRRDVDAENGSGHYHLAQYPGSLCSRNV